jgi:hypothetical protein
LASTGESGMKMAMTKEKAMVTRPKKRKMIWYDLRCDGMCPRAYVIKLPN